MGRRVNVIHPGYVISKNDGQRHYVGYHALIRLYKLDPATCINIKYTKGLDTRGMDHYYPSKEGDYP